MTLEQLFAGMAIGGFVLALATVYIMVVSRPPEDK